MSDDFSDPVKRALASRVGNLCSNPKCRALTSGPQEDPAKAVNLGVAAHITAASPGGPRYDAEILPDERSGPANGVWLCQNCAKLWRHFMFLFPSLIFKSKTGGIFRHRAFDLVGDALRENRVDFHTYVDCRSRVACKYSDDFLCDLYEAHFGR